MVWAFFEEGNYNITVEEAYNYSMNNHESANTTTCQNDRFCYFDSEQDYNCYSVLQALE